MLETKNKQSQSCWSTENINYIETWNNEDSDNSKNHGKNLKWENRRDVHYITQLTWMIFT